MAKFYLKQVFYFILCLFVPFLSSGQKWVADTITVSIEPNDSVKSPFQIHQVHDFRLGNPCQLSVFEQKKWLFFPVDQIVKLPNSLATGLVQYFKTDTLPFEKYDLSVHEFYIKNSSEGKKRRLTLFSTIELTKIQDSASAFLGTFYYENSFVQNKKVPVVSGYEQLLGKWGKIFISDVLAVEQGVDLLLNNNLYHFRRNKTAVKRNLYTEADFFAGLNYWGIDGEIWFSEPEGNRIFNRGARIMRYVNHRDFQAIAFGQNLRLWNYRINDSWLFTHKMALLMGINNWKDMSTVAHKMEEILLFDISFTQRINYNVLDQPGIVFGIGLMEDLHYIVYHQPKLNIGLSFNCAYKF